MQFSEYKKLLPGAFSGNKCLICKKVIENNDEIKIISLQREYYISRYAVHENCVSMKEEFKIKV